MTPNAEPNVGHDTVMASIALGLLLASPSCVCCYVFGRPYYRSRLWYTVSSVCRLSSVCRPNVLYCGETVRLSEKRSEGVNSNQGQKVDFLGRHHISTSGFGSTATKTAVFAVFLPVQPSDRLVLDGTSGLSSSKPCVYCRIMWSELKPEVVSTMIIDLERCK